MFESGGILWRVVQRKCVGGNGVAAIRKDCAKQEAVLVDHVLPEHRDMQVGSGMEAGMQDAYDLLEEVAVSLA